MGRKTDLPTEMVEAAREVMNRTKDAGELRRALSVVLSGVLGFTLPAVAEVMGRSRATVGLIVRMRAAFSKIILESQSEMAPGRAGGLPVLWLKSDRTKLTGWPAREVFHVVMCSITSSMGGAS